MNTPVKAVRTLQGGGSDPKVPIPVTRSSKLVASTDNGCSVTGLAQTGADASTWLKQHCDELAIADEILARKLSNARGGEFTNIALIDEIFNNILMSNLKPSNGTTECNTMGVDAGEGAAVCNSSVLLLGEAGTGKTHAVEYCLERLREARPAENTIVLRAFGGAYATDVECVRHLAAQVRGGNLSELDVDMPSRNASFETGMDWIRGVLREGFRYTSAVVIVLEKFENFCSKARQTLLYNLFDIAQESGVRLSIIGTSENMDVMDLLEKRIKSRFSMRYLHTNRPKSIEDLFSILLEKLRLPSNDDRLKPSFVKIFNCRLEAALRLKKTCWLPHLDVGMPPSWFLWRCLPVSRLIQEADPSGVVDLEMPAGPQAKRQKQMLPDVLSGSFLPSYTRHEVLSVLVRGLSEDQHIVMLALHRLQVREAVQTLAMVLHELRTLHENNPMLTRFNEDRYSYAFEALQHAGLIESATPGAGDPPRRYMACQSSASRLYAAFVGELVGGAAASHTAKTMDNPLQYLPEQVKQWAIEQLRREH